MANCAAVRADTSSAAAGRTPRVGVAAAALCAAMAEPTVCKSPAAAASDSGCRVPTQDIGLLLNELVRPRNGPPSLWRCQGATDSTRALRTCQVVGPADQTAEKRRDRIGEKRSSISYSKCQSDQSCPTSRHDRCTRECLRGGTIRDEVPSEICQARHPSRPSFGTQSVSGASGAGSHLAELICKQEPC